MTILRDWLEEHWTTVGVVASIAGALTFSILLAVAFNVIATRHDRLRSEAPSAAPPVSNAGVRAGTRAVAGPI